MVDVPIEVKSATGVWTAAGVWALVLSAALAALVKGLPRLYELWIGRDGAMRKERAADEATLAGRVLALERRAESAERTAIYLTNAVTLALNALDSDDTVTRAAAAHQARELVAMAAAADDGFGKALARLALVKGVGE